MQTLDERQVREADRNQSKPDLLFLALNDFEEFERAVLLRGQDSQRRALQHVKTA